MNEFEIRRISFWRRRHLDRPIANLNRDQIGVVVCLMHHGDRNEVAGVKVGAFLAAAEDENSRIEQIGRRTVRRLAGDGTPDRERKLIGDRSRRHKLIDIRRERARRSSQPQLRRA